MATLSAHEVARENQRRGETLSKAVDRLRYWVSIGAIKPIGEQNPGTGRHRRFHALATLEMALLQALTDAGLEAKDAVDLLRSGQYLAPFCQIPMPPGEKLKPLLVISRSTDGKTFDDARMATPDELLVWITKADREIFTHDLYRVIDVQKMRDRLIRKIQWWEHGTAPNGGAAA